MSRCSATAIHRHRSLDFQHPGFTIISLREGHIYVMHFSVSIDLTVFWIGMLADARPPDIVIELKTFLETETFRIGIYSVLLTDFIHAFSTTNLGSRKDWGAEVTDSKLNLEKSKFKNEFKTLETKKSKSEAPRTELTTLNT